jgi:hypothetical protein
MRTVVSELSESHQLLAGNAEIETESAAFFQIILCGQSGARYACSSCTPRPGKRHRGQADGIDLGVNERRVKFAVPQNISDLLERTTAFEQPAGQCITQRMYASVDQSTAFVCRENGAPDRARSDGIADGTDMPNEHTAAGGARSLRGYVAGNCATRCVRQWQCIHASRFAATDSDDASVPINVAEIETNHLMCSQAKINETANHGKRAAHRWHARSK